MNIVTINGQKYYIYKNNDDRVVAVYVDKDGKHRTKSYPRLLLEEKLGREL